MAAATITTKSVRTPSRTSPKTSSRTPLKTSRRTSPALKRKPLPAGRPREWYETHNRRLKAMRLAIALLDSGVYAPEKASNRRIRSTAARIGIHPPSNTTCRMVRTLIG
ncbi:MULTISPECIES: hypothetical protein [unclassified Streptomyces]|uniref:hypothetical protein n=1 Tax=unclassified Streptomyces TaxID=2593676 RepID=UPI002E2B3CCF|nr:hypothetical protein [Streptomyces sp. NBC_01429]